tara:strand:+ start:1353 stop:2570 length:1218 start_codon:yes stop_codon:yes gene_type:complete
MPRHNLIGVKCRNSILFHNNNNNYHETIVYFETLLNDPKVCKIIKPTYQGALIENKTEEMVKEYNENPSLLRTKNKIIIGCLHDKWYIVDGQHRLDMALTLYKDYNKNDSLIFCWYGCKNDKEMKNLFFSLNKDSVKNQFYIDNKDYKEFIINHFKETLNLYLKNHFSKKKTTNGKIMCIEEFIEKLIKKGFFDLEMCSDAKKSYEYLMKKNNEYYKLYNYDIHLIQNRTNFYVDEIKCINSSKIILSLKQNNFIDWLMDPINNKPIHKNKRGNKKQISNYKKKKVWINEFGENSLTEIIPTRTCPISFCNNKLIWGKKNGWHCGHIISEHNDGETEPNNLRPICPDCNSSMGHQNWVDYDKQSISPSSITPSSISPLSPSSITPSSITPSSINTIINNTIINNT